MKYISLPYPPLLYPLYPQFLYPLYPPLLYPPLTFSKLSVSISKLLIKPDGSMSIYIGIWNVLVSTWY